MDFDNVFHQIVGVVSATIFTIQFCTVVSILIYFDIYDLAVTATPTGRMLHATP